MGEGRFGETTWTELLVAERAGRPVGAASVWLDVDARELFVDPTTPAEPDGALAIVAEAGPARPWRPRPTGGAPSWCWSPARPDPAGPTATDEPGPARHAPHRRLRPGARRGRRSSGTSAACSTTPRRRLRPRPRASLDLVALALRARASSSASGTAACAEIEPAPPDPDPFATGGVGIAPDRFPALVLGRWGAAGLAARADDVVLGAHAGLLEVLFPARPSDVVVDL